MKLLSLLSLIFWVQLSFAKDVMDKIRSMEVNHPGFPDAVVELQTQMLREKRWENTLGIGHVFRKNFSHNESTFRVEPFLMEAYSLIQFCRYEDARTVLEMGEYYARKYHRKEDELKIKKAKELEQLSKLYKNLNPAKVQKTNFTANQLEWPVEPLNKDIFKVLDIVIIKTESSCQS